MQTEEASAGALVAKLRAAGMDVWLDGGLISSRWRAGGRAPYGVAVMLAELRDLGMVAVDFLQHEVPAKPVSSNEVHQLDGMNATEAASLIEFIREGKGELIGQFVYHKSTGRFDATVRFLEGWDS